MWLVGIALEAAHTNMGDGTISAVCLALTLTFMCYVMIFGLDKLADADWTDDDVDETLRELIKALGILIGFAWEKSFDAAVVNIAKKVLIQESIPAPVTKLMLSILVCCTVIPAWLWYILPELQKLGVFNEGEEEEEEEGEEEDSNEKADPESASGKAGALDEPLLVGLKKDQETLRQLKQGERDRIAKMKALQKELAKNAQSSSQITQDIQNALVEVSKVRSQLGVGR